MIRVCFTLLLQFTLKWDLKRRSNLQINFNSPAKASLYELLCYHSLELLAPIMDEFLTFIHSTLSSFYSLPATSTAPPEATDGNVNDP